MVKNKRKGPNSARQNRRSSVPRKQNREKIIKIGTVVEALPNATFRAQLDSGDEGLVFAHLSGKMRMYRIKVLVGDKVKMEMDEYDSAKGRIIQRL